MPKQKTHKGLKKRMKVTARGKVMRMQAGKSHLMSGKSASNRRGLRKSIEINSTVLQKHRVLLG